MGFPSSTTVAVKRAYNSGIYGGYIGAASFIGVTPALVSTYVDLPTTSSVAVTSFGFGGGTVKVEILNAATAGSDVLQTLSVPFPSATFPVPALAPLLKDTSVWIDYRDTRAGPSLHRLRWEHDSPARPTRRQTPRARRARRCSSVAKTWCAVCRP